MRIILNKDTPGGYVTVVYDLTLLLLHTYNTYIHTIPLYYIIIETFLFICTLHYSYLWVLHTD